MAEAVFIPNKYVEKMTCPVWVDLRKKPDSTALRIGGLDDS
jgi:hypothetical protein